MGRSFEVRGVIEGFYGPPWSASGRREVLSALAERGMNAYVHAPKDDLYHRLAWRDPYPEADLAGLIETHRHCEAIGVRFGYAISPGLDIDYDDPGDRESLWAKLSPFLDAGVEWFVLAFDDVPVRAGAAAGQAGLVAWLRERTSAHLTVVPTEYVGTRPSEALDELVAGLPEGVDLMWTGSTVVPPRITAAEAEARRAATGGLPLLLWDNYPVNDAFMAHSLHLDALRGREPGLADVCRGVLANPMPHARASLVALATVADFLADPDGYDPDESWARAFAVFGSEHEPSVSALARACAGTCLDPRVPLQDLVDDVEAGTSDLTEITAELRRAAELPGGLPDALADEVRPWADQAAREASAGLAALGILQAGPGNDAWAGIASVLGMLYLWNAARSEASHVAFGARFACYPGIVVDDAGRPAIDASLSLVEDANAIDRLCRLALARSSV